MPLQQAISGSTAAVVKRFATVSPPLMCVEDAYLPFTPKTLLSFKKTGNSRNQPGIWSLWKSTAKKQGIGFELKEKDERKGGPVRWQEN